MSATSRERKRLAHLRPRTAAKLPHCPLDPAATIPLSAAGAGPRELARREALVVGHDERRAGQSEEHALLHDAADERDAQRSLIHVVVAHHGRDRHVDAQLAAEDRAGLAPVVLEEARDGELAEVTRVARVERAVDVVADAEEVGGAGLLELGLDLDALRQGRAGAEVHRRRPERELPATRHVGLVAAGGDRRVTAGDEAGADEHGEREQSEHEATHPRTATVPSPADASPCATAPGPPRPALGMSSWPNRASDVDGRGRVHDLEAAAAALDRRRGRLD